MRQRSPALPAPVRGLLLAGLTTALTVTGHLVGGGSLPGLVPVTVLMPLLAMVLVTLADRCRGIVGLLLTLGAGQVALHLLMLVLGTHSMAAMTFSTPSMVSGHAVATLVTAVVLSHAETAVLAVAAALMRVLPRRLRLLAIDVEPATRPVPPPDVPLRAALVPVGATSVGDLRSPAEACPTQHPPGHSGGTPHRSVMSHALCRSAVRGTGVLAVAAAAVLATATPAFAHVTAHSSDATQGGTSVMTLRVPNESTTAGTVKLAVKVPTQYAITAARTTPVAGWTATISRTAIDPPVRQGDQDISDAVSEVTWTANPGTRIKPDEFLDFPLSLGPLPRVEQLVLPATQTYDDGHAVAWDQPPTTGPEPEHPAPVVALAPAPADASTDGMSGMTGHAGHTAGSGTSTADAMTSADGTARWLGIGGLLLGALGLGIGLRTAARGRPQPTLVEHREPS